MTLRYPGRGVLTADKFLDLRPDIRQSPIYDLQLSTGDLLYRCAAGGVGVTKEKHIPQLHSFLQNKNSVSIIETMWKDELKAGECDKSFTAAKAKFNSKTPRLASWSDCARLYCLLIGSGYSHLYSNKSFVGSYFPYNPDFISLRQFSELSRANKLEFDTTDMFSFKEQEVSKNTVIHLHIPHKFGVYGLGYVWSKRKLKTIRSVFNDLDELGYRICVSALYQKRNYLVHGEDLFPSFHKNIVVHQDDEKYGLVRLTSEIYYTNFVP